MSVKIIIIAALVGLVGAYLDLYVTTPPIGYIICILTGAMILSKEQNGN